MASSYSLCVAYILLDNLQEVSSTGCVVTCTMPTLANSFGLHKSGAHINTGRKDHLALMV